MNEVLMHAVASAGWLPPARPQVRNALLQVAALIQGQQVSVHNNTQARSDACVLLPQCGVLLVGTACQAPLLRPEAAEIAASMGVSVLLLRVDVDHGVSVDLLLAHHTGWLCNYRLESRPDGLFLVPPRSNQPHLGLSADGMAETAPSAFNGTVLTRSEGGNV